MIKYTGKIKNKAAGGGEEAPMGNSQILGMYKPASPIQFKKQIKWFLSLMLCKLIGCEIKSSGDY